MNVFLHTTHCRRGGLAFPSSLPFVKSRNTTRYLSLGPAILPSYSGRVPQVPYGFRELGIRDAIAKAITEAFPDVQRPTISQADFIPAILKGKDVLLDDDTGTGKSFGSIVALLNKPRGKVSGEEGPSITSLVIVPHRDLGYQMMQWIEAIVRHSGPKAPPTDTIAQLLVRSDSIPLDQQKHKLRSTPPHILIGTPQALWEIYNNADKRDLQLERVSTIVIDEVDYLLDIPSPYVRKKRESSVWRNFKRHPSLTRRILEEVLPLRKDGAVPLCETDYDERGRIGGGRAVQVVMSSATVHSNLVDYLCDARWLDEDRVILSGKQLLKANSHMVAEKGRNIVHHAFVVSPDGKVRNADFVEKEKEEIPRDIITCIPAQSATSGLVMEAIASIFAVDVAQIALLVLPPGSSIKKTINELQVLAIDARPLDLRNQHPLGGHPVLLVATPASIRGLDLPMLTHVFCAGAPDTASADVFKHVAGRVGRFGRAGKVMTFVTEREVEDEDGVVKTRKNPAGLLQTFYRKLNISPRLFDLTVLGHRSDAVRQLSCS